MTNYVYPYSGYAIAFYLHCIIDIRRDAQTLLKYLISFRAENPFECFLIPEQIKIEKLSARN
jgi:hypothetical protein